MIRTHQAGQPPRTASIIFFSTAEGIVPDICVFKSPEECKNKKNKTVRSN